MVDSGLLGVPLYTLAGYKGMGESPKALRKAGLLSALGGPADLKDVRLPPLKKDSEEGGVKNLAHFKDSTSRIYEAARSMRRDRAYIVGGECSVTLGSLAGFSEVFGGRPGMLWMDAHGDFNTPETSPSGYIGGMCLAMACGRGPPMSEEVERHRPLLAEERLVHLGSRALDQPEVTAFNSSPAKLFTSQHVKKSGAAEVAREAARHLENRADWIACHFDVDVIDPAFLPAVNYPTEGGLTPGEAAIIIKALNGTGKVRLVELCSYNSSSDSGRRSARAIVEFMKQALS